MLPGATDGISENLKLRISELNKIWKMAAITSGHPAFEGLAGKLDAKSELEHRQHSHLGDQPINVT